MDRWIAGCTGYQLIAAESQGSTHELPHGGRFHPRFPGSCSARTTTRCDRSSHITPPNDVVLIGTTAKVLVRNDLHPQIVQLLLQTMVEVHGGANIFQRVGEFPNAADPEYPVAPAASDFYKSGPSLTQRYLPLWLSVHAQRAIAALVAGLAIGLPTFRFLPVFYQWVMRRRLIYWYAKLKALEASFDANANAISLPETKIEIERIEDAVSHIQFPLTFTDQLYNLRSHIDIVRRKIASRANTPGSKAAEQFHLAASGELAHNSAATE